MELPQSRPLERQEGRKETHDFLSLYEQVQQDPSSPPPPPPQGNFLRTQEFLQPLGTYSEKAPITLTEGIGNYIKKNDGNSNCSSYPVNGFTLWERSVMTKGKTRKENTAGGSDIPVTAEAAGITMGEGEWPSQSTSNNSSSNHHHLASTTYSSPSSSQPFSAKKTQSFMDMLKSAKVSHEEDEGGFIIKEEPSFNPTMTVDANQDEKKPSSPRSKHSATEQRRRSKINDRFQSLREIIPRNDQKRDKASFLLEVIEYIQHLQEKVQKYEEPPYQRWNQLEPSKSGPWASSHHNNNDRPAMMSTPIMNSINNNNDVKFWIPDCHMDGNKLKAQDQEHDVENDTIKISAAYSRGLLSNLTQALQSSGVDLSQATVSVKIDIKKQPIPMESRSGPSSKRQKTDT